MKIKRLNISSNTKWEDLFGYSRAVRIGNIVEVSGTASVDGGKIIGINNIYEQTIFILEKIERALLEANAKLSDVIRTRIYVTDINLQNEVGRAHAKFFKDIKPAVSMIEISSLILPELLVEIEATAIINK